MIENRVTSNWLFYNSRAIGTLSCAAISGLVARKWQGRMGAYRSKNNGNVERSL
jgi:hypothetical protein